MTVVETWRAVVGFEREYEVSDLGRVRSLDRVKTYERRNRFDGRVEQVSYPLKGRVLRTPPNSNGYPRVSLRNNGPVVFVHQLVLEAFVGPCPEGQQALHDNDTKTDNRLDNLSWGTNSQNQLDAVRNERVLLGEQKPGAKLKASDIPEIRLRIPAEGCVAVAKAYGVSETAIRHIKDGRSWKSVGENT